LKSFPERRSQKLLAMVAVVSCVVGLRAELTKWVEDIDAGSRLENVFFRTVLLPSGPVPVRRPPKETTAELSKMIAAAPNDAELYSLRALEAEQALDFATAEADWKKYIETAADKGAARLALADFYHRRLESEKEFEALTFAAREYEPDFEKLLPVAQRRPWKTYERLFKLIDDAQLDSEYGVTQSIAWILRYPDQPSLHTRYFRYAMDHRRYDAAVQAIAGYQRAFPKDEEFPIEARAELAAKTGSTAAAIAEYENSFRPLWPAPLVKQYFDLLKRTGGLRAYLERARASVAANPQDLSRAARLFYYWQQQNNMAAAERALLEFRDRKKSGWTPDELLTLGRLLESAHNYDEAARNYYALYNAGGATAETGLAGLAKLLFSAPEQPIQFGSGNLTLYRDVATMDPHPGFLNGVLSLVLNGADPPNRYALEEQSAGAYFRRMRAAELVALFESKFPTSSERTDLRERVIEAYAAYGSNEGVIRAGTKFLTDFPSAANRTSVAMRMADAYARLNQTQQEFATYDALLAELAKRADNVPMGALGKPEQLRSPEYARVLDRYVARLVSLKRLPDALALYRREIGRNPKDPGLYDTLAAFLDQNKLGAEIEQVYQRAIAEFQDHNWEHKLARWYLRQRRQADVSRVTRDVVKIFSGTELDAYFKEIVNPAAPVGPALYLQLNLYAHQRFPHHLNFVRNLLSAYSAQATRDDSAYEALLRRHWDDAEDLRMRLFERLSRTRRLDAELTLVRTSNPPAALDQNPVAERMLAEGEAWRGHFESAAPMMLALETNYPTDRVIGRRAAAVERSLGGIDSSVTVEEKLNRADPRDHVALTRLGEIEADRERFDRASAYWNRIAQIAPAKPDSYLETATIFWDYYRYDDALRVIGEARQKLDNPALFAYEAGAIRENQRSYDFAVREYARGAIASPGSGAEQRLLLLARRPALRADVEQLTANLVSARNPEIGMLHLRVALLRNQNRRDDLEKLLLEVAGRTNVPELLSAIENDGRVDGFSKVQQTAIEREIAVTTDPVDKMRLRLSLARFFEGQGQTAQGAQVVDALYRENPAILGVVRAAVDYHWRNKNAKRAVDVLEESAGRAQPGYRSQFTLEASRKAMEAGDYARARGFVAKLLADTPANAEYIAVMADTFARQGDDRGLRAFYDAKIREVRGLDQVASMRRALIPVLTRMKDFAAGVDQYIEVLNRFPEDDGLAREAAAYASSNGVAQRLRDYYAKAANDSPKDFRWPMVLARIETQLEDFPAAIASYTRAAGVRPDRPDLLEGRLNLEERLLRFDEAGATAEKLYELTYRNPQWMAKLAEIRARQGRSADAVGALRKAWIDGRSDSAEKYFQVAHALESWGLVKEAWGFAQEGLKRQAPGEKTDVGELIARLRIYDSVATEGGRAFSAAVAKYYSPDDKVKLAKYPAIKLQDAGMADVEAKQAFDALIAGPDEERKQKLIEIQKRRLAFEELGSQMERTDDLLEAAEAYRASGNTAAELRVLQAQHGHNALNGPLFDRYCQLLMAQPQAMIAAIGRGRGSANAMANYVLQHGSAAVAQQAITARGQRMGPLWTKAYTGLTGMYFGTNVRPVFTGILGDMSIGPRIGKAVDRNQQLAGDVWFYYAGRFGEYAKFDDFLPAIVEATPGRSEAYFTLAEQTGSVDDYRHALELNPLRADVHDRLAALATKSGQTSGTPDEALKEWRLALSALTEMMNRSRVPQKFWTDFSDMLRHVGEAKALSPLRDDIEKLLRLYIRRNGAFQADVLMEGALAAGGDVAWIGELSRSAADPVQFLSAMIEQPWIPETQKDILYARIVESSRARFARSFGDQRFDAEFQWWRWQIAWAEYLFARGENQRAAELIRGLPESARKEKPEIFGLELRIADRTGTLKDLLARYQGAVEALRTSMQLEAVREYVYSHELKAGNLDAANFLGLAEIRLAQKDSAEALALMRRMTLVSGAPFTTLDSAAALLEKTGHAAEAAEFLSTLVKAEPWNWDARGRLASVRGSIPDLTAVAKSSDAPYDTRVAAARAIRRLKGAPLAGTEPELVALSSQLGDVDKPYWVAARIDAGGEKALAAAIAIDPKTPKLPLFRAAVAARHDAFAIAIARQMAPYISEETEFTPWAADGFLNAMSEADRVEIARGLGGANQRIGDLRESALFYQIAQKIQPNGATAGALVAVRVQIDVNAKNDARRPVVTDHLDQDRLVHARVTQ